MTSRAVSIMKVDEALADRYSGITIDIEGVPTAVEVFIEQPMPEEYIERVYPSIAISLISVLENTETLDSEDDESEEVGYDTGIIPFQRYMRERPIPSRLIYSVTAWHRIRVAEARDLLHGALTRKTRPKGSLTVENLDGTGIDVWTFWSGGIQSASEVDSDFMVYRNTVTLAVLADISPVDFDDYVSQKVVMDLRWEVYSRRWVIDGTGISILEGGDILDRIVRAGIDMDGVFLIEDSTGYLLIEDSTGNLLIEE